VINKSILSKPINIGVGDLPSEVLLRTEFNATTFLYATLDDTPEPKTIAEVLALLGLASYEMDTVEKDIDFVASDEEDITVDLGMEFRELIRGRVWIDVDPGVAFSAWLTLTFYNKAAMRGEDAFYRTAAKLVYTELEVATSVGSPNVTPDDQTDFSPNDLALILDTSDELVRFKTIADTMVAEDNLLAVHAIGQGLVRVVEFSGFSLVNLELGNDVYVRLSFAANQTVSLKMELVMGK